MQWNSKTVKGAASALIMSIMLLLIACPVPELPVSPTLTPTAAPELPLELAVMVPEDGTATPRDEESMEFIIGTWGFPVIGITRVDGVVTVNGTPVEVNEDGMFVHSVGLAEGPNLVEVTASDLLGNQRTISIVVYQVSAAGIPLYVFWPITNDTVNSASVSVIGTTSVDAVVTVNGVPVEVDILGIFSTSVALEEGPNAIEVTVSDLLGNVQSQAVVVFRMP